MASSDDLDEALRFAQLHPHARWYVADRARALGAPDRIPGDWGIPAPAPVVADASEAADPGAADIVIPEYEGLDDEPITAGVASEGEHLAKKAGHTFDAALHPRGKDGKFIEKGGHVIVDGPGGSKFEGKVSGISKDAGPGGAVITVTPDRGGSDVTVRPNQVSAAPVAQAHIAVGDRVQHAPTGGRGTVRQVHDDGTATVEYDRTGSGPGGYGRSSHEDLKPTGEPPAQKPVRLEGNESIAVTGPRAGQKIPTRSAQDLTPHGRDQLEENEASTRFHQEGLENQRKREQLGRTRGDADTVEDAVAGQSWHRESLAGLAKQREQIFAQHSSVQRPTPTTHPDTPAHPADSPPPRVRDRARMEYHNSNENSHKFYESSVIEHQNGTASHVTSWGRVGAKPSYKVDLHPGATEAEAAHYKKTVEKERAGYAHVSQEPDFGAHMAQADARHPETRAARREADKAQVAKDHADAMDALNSPDSEWTAPPSTGPGTPSTESLREKIGGDALTTGPSSISNEEVRARAESAGLVRTSAVPAPDDGPTLRVANEAQRVLMEQHIKGQISDGMWENTNHGRSMRTGVAGEGWKDWTDAKVVVDPNHTGRNFHASKDNYQLNSSNLVGIVGDDMLQSVRQATGNPNYSEKDLRKDLAGLSKHFKTRRDSIKAEESHPQTSVEVAPRMHAPGGHVYSGEQLGEGAHDGLARADELSQEAHEFTAGLTAPMTPEEFGHAASLHEEAADAHREAGNHEQAAHHNAEADRLSNLGLDREDQLAQEGKLESPRGGLDTAAARDMSDEELAQHVHDSRSLGGQEGYHQELADRGLSLGEARDTGRVHATAPDTTGRSTTKRAEQVAREADHPLNKIADSVVNKGIGTREGVADRVSEILNNPDHEAAHRDLAKLMGEAKLGGKQRARYREILNQHHGSSGSGRPAGSLAEGNMLRDRLAAKQNGGSLGGHPDTGAHPAGTTGDGFEPNWNDDNIEDRENADGSVTQVWQEGTQYHWQNLDPEGIRRDAAGTGSQEGYAPDRASAIKAADEAHAAGEGPMPEVPGSHEVGSGEPGYAQASRQAQHPADEPGVGHIGEPLKTRKAAEARLARESDYLARNQMTGEVAQLPDGRWTVRTRDTLNTGTHPADEPFQVQSTGGLHHVVDTRTGERVYSDDSKEYAADSAAKRNAGAHPADESTPLDYSGAGEEALRYYSAGKPKGAAGQAVQNEARAELQRRGLPHNSPEQEAAIRERRRINRAILDGGEYNATADRRHLGAPLAEGQAARTPDEAHADVMERHGGHVHAGDQPGGGRLTSSEAVVRGMPTDVLEQTRRSMEARRSAGEEINEAHLANIRAEQGRREASEVVKNEPTVPPHPMDDIAREHLGVDTLRGRNNDTHDFPEVGNAGMRKALQAAFERGGGKRQLAQEEHDRFASDVGLEHDLKDHNNDSQDFHETGVGYISRMLQNAESEGRYESGAEHPARTLSRRLEAAPYHPLQHLSNEGLKDIAREHAATPVRTARPSETLSAGDARAAAKDLLSRRASERERIKSDVANWSDEHLASASTNSSDSRVDRAAREELKRRQVTKTPEEHLSGLTQAWKEFHSGEGVGMRERDEIAKRESAADRAGVPFSSIMDASETGRRQAFESFSDDKLKQLQRDPATRGMASDVLGERSRQREKEASARQQASVRSTNPAAVKRDDIRSATREALQAELRNEPLGERASHISDELKRRRTEDSAARKRLSRMSARELERLVREGGPDSALASQLLARRRR